MYTDDERLRGIAKSFLTVSRSQEHPPLVHVDEHLLFLLLKAEAQHAAEQAIERVHADILELTLNRPKTPPQPGQNRRKTDV